MTTKKHESLAAALAAVQAALPVVHKGKTASIVSQKGQYTYTYADLADVTAAIMPLLAANGLSFSCTPRQFSGGYELAGVLLHESGQTLEGALPLTGGTPQQWGSSITYMRRYLLGCMTGIVTDDDDDARIATEAAKEVARQTRKAATEDALPRISETQSKRLHALFREAGAAERDQKMKVIEWFIRNHSDGRPIESSSELTTREASGLMDYLAERIATQKAEQAANAEPQEAAQ